MLLMRNVNSGEITKEPVIPIASLGIKSITEEDLEMALEQKNFAMNMLVKLIAITIQMEWGRDMHLFKFWHPS